MGIFLCNPGKVSKSLIGAGRESLALRFVIIKMWLRRDQYQSINYSKWRWDSNWGRVSSYGYKWTLHCSNGSRVWESWSVRRVHASRLIDQRGMNVPHYKVHQSWISSVNGICVLLWSGRPGSQFQQILSAQRYMKSRTSSNASVLGTRIQWFSSNWMCQSDLTANIYMNEQRQIITVTHKRTIEKILSAIDVEVPPKLEAEAVFV